MTSKMLARKVIRVACVVSVLGLSAAVGGGPAVAQKPVVDSGALPPDGAPHPDGPTERPQNSHCPVGTMYVPDGPVPPAPQATLDLAQAWQFATGAGQTVAVIDTGVARHPRLPGLIPGGDYVSGSDGTEDCDAHGTLVAGIIGASRVPDHGFAGVAPDARILAIRANSSQYQQKGASANKGPDALPDGYGNTKLLAEAVRHAADMGASVINMSLVACQTQIEDRALGAAVQYATVKKNAVVVAAAGNKDHDCKNATNPVQDPTKPNADPWSQVNAEVTPARYDDYVLSVGSVDANGQPSKFTVPGPWLGVAAPGENITSLDVNYNQADHTGLANGMMSGNNQQEAAQGTSFAAPYVAGLAALVRQRFPQLSAQEVIKRIEATAHRPPEGWSPFLGYGTIDPAAALTDQVTNPLPPKRPNPAISMQLPVPPHSATPDHTARNVALIGTGVIAVLLILGYLASFPIRRRFEMRNDR